MDLSTGGMASTELKQAVQVNVMQKQMTSEVQSMKTIKDMLSDVAQMTGKGQALDLVG